MSGRFRGMLATAVCKGLRMLLHLAGRGGTTLPGRLAGMIDPDILARVSAGMHIVIVTGTNGKTTTCRILADAFFSSSLTVHRADATGTIV